ncbi:MAG TPA: NlpC/P60 family protein, partial [Nannocystaceae bacterium]|nr:NlpC/P60 family protein [Nannocystaceae bacterium]
GDPYGWGGKDGARDCSQFLHDLFAGFGIPLGRHSSVQATQGTANVDVAGWTEADKLAAIDDAAHDGVVLLYMPGHVMLDVGKDGDRRFAISAIAEYVEPCAGAGETLRRLDRVAVTDLELGRGSSRGAFIERITRIAVFGPQP